MEGKTYKFNGSSFGVQTGYAASKTITAITLANPAVITAPAHGYSDADVVRLNDIITPSELDGKLVVVDNVATNTFEAAGVDTTDSVAFSDDSPPTADATKVTFTEFCELTGLSQQDAGADQHDVSTICSTAKQFVQGLSDSGTLQLDYNLAGNETTQAALRTAKIASTPIAVKLTFPEEGGIVVMIGTVQQTSFTGSYSSVVFTGSATIKLSGEVFWLDNAA